MLLTTLKTTKHCSLKYLQDSTCQLGQDNNGIHSRKPRGTLNPPAVLSHLILSFISGLPLFSASVSLQVADLNALAELGKVYQDSLALSAQLRNLSSFRLQQDKVLGRGSLAVVQEGGWALRVRTGFVPVHVHVHAFRQGRGRGRGSLAVMQEGVLGVAIRSKVCVGDGDRMCAG